MIKFILYIIGLAAIHAQLELMIGGQRGGWAMKLSCWRVDNKFTQFILGKELTGYHIWLLFMFLFVFHGAFLFTNWTIQKESILLGFFNFYWILEDWFWFLENRYYGLRNFKKGRIFWHKRWFLGIPYSYWIGIIFGTILIYLGLK